MAKLISNTYAEALFELAAEKNKLDEMLEQTELLKKLIGDNPEFIGLITNPGITKEDKQKAIVSIMSGRFDDDLTGLVRTVTEKDRGKELKKIFDLFRLKVYEYKRIGLAEVRSAIALSDAQKKNIEKNLLEHTGFKSLETTYEVDEKLIGGMVIRIGDRVADSSIKNKLERMTAALRKAKN